MMLGTSPTPETGSSKVTLLKVLVPLSAILIAAIGALYAIKWQLKQTEAPQAAAEIQVGAVLPDFTLQQLEGKSLKASELPSQVTLINFWATWCEACMVEMPSIQKLRQAYQSKGFDVIAVNLDQNPQAVVPRTVRKLGIDFPIYVDRDQKLSDLFAIEAIPLTVIIDKNRKVLLVENGERDWNGSDIRAELERWLAAR